MFCNTLLMCQPVLRCGQWSNLWNTGICFCIWKAMISLHISAHTFTRNRLYRSSVWLWFELCNSNSNCRYCVSVNLLKLFWSFAWLPPRSYQSFHIVYSFKVYFQFHKNYLIYSLYRTLVYTANNGYSWYLSAVGLLHRKSSLSTAWRWLILEKQCRLF